MKTLLTLLALVPALATAGGAGDRADSRTWQIERLFHPTPQDLAHEARGQVFIYDGLHDTDIERALQREFDRVDSMMFVRTVMTDRAGAPLQDETGGHVTEDDGCD